jgi:tetratricopeptide (TPR) repeat protein
VTQTADVDVGFARRAETLHRHGDSASALHLLTAGVRRFPGDVTALLVLARVCREAGREDEARDWIDAALRLDPGCPAALAHTRKADFGSQPPGTRRPAPVTPEPFRGSDDDSFSSPRAEPFTTRRETAPAVASPFVFPVHEEDEDPEIDENSAPHVATVTLAEIYLQQGLKEQAAQIYRQLLERQPEDDSARRRLQEILREIEGS